MSPSNQIHRQLDFDDPKAARELFGPANANLKRLSDNCGLELQTSGASLSIVGKDAEKVELAASLFVQMYSMARKGRPVRARDLSFAWRMLEKDPSTDIKEIFKDAIIAPSTKESVTPRSVVQKEYLEAMRSSDMVFGVGPAGTGKTYLAVAMAVSFLMEHRVKRLVLTRPAVEAGERLGFLPGDMVEKVNPYLRPLYDALNDLLDFRKVKEMLETGVIEIAPLAFMRGRTLNDAFIILDEAQNTTPEQMKMFLTRLGFGSRAVITGDITQIDLPIQRFGAGAAKDPTHRSGLVQAIRVLSGVKGLSFVTFGPEDVIRHKLVSRIVAAYEEHERGEE